MLGSAFNKMDLVTREEFDIQQQVLIKTRTKLVELEERLARLEANQSVPVVIEQIDKGLVNDKVVSQQVE